MKTQKEQTPSIESFSNFYMEELFCHFDTQQGNGGDIPYQRLRFLIVESADRLIESTTVWLEKSEKADFLVEREQTHHGVQSSPNSAQRLARNKRMFQELGCSSAFQTNGVLGNDEIQGDLFNGLLQDPNLLGVGQQRVEGINSASANRLSLKHNILSLSIDYVKELNIKLLTKSNLF